MTVQEATEVFCLETAVWERKQLKQAFGGQSEIKVRFMTDHLQHAIDGLSEARVLSIFIRSRVDTASLDSLPLLKLITTRSTGYDHIDLVACAKRGVVVCNVPTYGENTVAEHTFALILALSRRLLAAERKGSRCDFDLSELQGFDLKGKTLGVIGAGRIGLHVIRIARAFGMNVLAYDPHREDLLAEVLGFQYVDLDDVLKHCDVLTLHAPGTPQTDHLINAKALAKLRRGALLINTARGSIVDTSALIAALDDGHLGGAGLDVFEGEQKIQEEHELLLHSETDSAIRTAFTRRLLADYNNVILTPHNAFNSHEAVQRIADTTVDNIVCWLRNKSRNVLTDPYRCRDQA